MSESNKSIYIFIEKFFRELYDSVHHVDFFYLNTMFNTLTDEMRALFLGTLLLFEDNSVLFTITKQKLLNVLKSVIVDVSIGKPKKLKTFESYIDFHKYKRNLAETMTSVFKAKGFIGDGQRSYDLMETYKKWSNIDLVKAKTKLELALIFIDQLGVINDFYSFVEKFENGMFLQYLEDIKNFTIELLKYREEGGLLTKNTEFI
ncbi:MAG: hypothetical protein V3V33_15930 [Candidatus Lokiarchaeia archaeon]